MNNNKKYTYIIYIIRRIIIYKYVYIINIGIGENIRFFRFGVLFSENIEQNMEKN